MKRFLRPLAVSLSLAFVTAFGLVGAFNAGIASADPVVTDAGIGSGSGSAIAVATGSGSGSAVIVDPAADPSATLSMWAKLYKSGAFFALGIVVLFSVLYVLDEKIAWLRTGKRGVYVAAAIGGLAVVFVPASQGNTPTLAMFMTALTTAVALIINPTKKDPSSST